MGATPMDAEPYGADGRRHVMLLGVEVKDQQGYARYRAAMTPILTSYGGSFGCDFVVTQVLAGSPAPLNRVFTLTFPDRGTRTRFFDDPDYRAVRGTLFASAVARIVTLGEFDESGEPLSEEGDRSPR